MNKKSPVEFLHFFTGGILILAGIFAFFDDGIVSMLSWCIFGSMYISMSDIGECQMCCTEKTSKKYKIRFFGAYLGAALAVLLLMTFIVSKF